MNHQDILAKKKATSGKIELETNGCGEVFITYGKTKLRLSAVSDGLMVTFTGNGGNFIPHCHNRLPAIIFRSTNQTMKTETGGL